MMKRITRKERLTSEEAAKIKAVRKQVAEELPDLIARHDERMAALDQLQGLLQQLKTAREKRGLSLADLTELTGMDRSALSKLENGQRPNPTVETLVRYAEAVGKHLKIELEDQDDVLDKWFESFLHAFIHEIHKKQEKDCVAKALYCLLVREANTWRSIRVLQKNTRVEFHDVFMVDAGTLLRAMFDAYLQADFIYRDPSERKQRATDYLDFEHVERYRMQEKVLKHDNELVTRLSSSARKLEGEKRVLEQFERVKDRFLEEKKCRDGKVKVGPATRMHWYKGGLPHLAKAAGRMAEYDTFVASFGGCVHSSIFAVLNGPPVRSQNALFLASEFTARVAIMNAEYNRIYIGDDRANLDELAKSGLDNS